jgi:hypothetical protein
VREKMLKLEEENKTSHSKLNGTARTELNRIQDTIERLKKEFEVLLEGEKQSLTEDEYNAIKMIEVNLYVIAIYIVGSGGEI